MVLELPTEMRMLGHNIVSLLYWLPRHPSIEGNVGATMEYPKSCFSRYPVYKTRSLDTFADEL